MMPQVPNKLASIFVVGTLSLVLCWIHFPQEILQLLHIPIASAEEQQEQEPILERGASENGKEPASDSTKNGWSALSIIPLTFGLLAMAGISGVLGASIQGLAGIVVRFLFQKFANHCWFCCVLFKWKERREIIHWARAYRKLAGASKSRYRLVYRSEGGEDKVDGWPHPFSPLVPALFFKMETPHMNWVLQHYATYYLVTDLSVVVLLSLGLAVGNSAALGGIVPLGWVITVHLLALYGLLAIALHRYLYTYNAALRHCYLLLLDEQKKQGAV